MKAVNLLRSRRAIAAVALATAMAIAAPIGVGTANAASTKPTIVLVHGAWADNSSFSKVTAELQHDGYKVVNAPNELRGLASDAANVAAFVNQHTSGPVVLVGHSYGGAVITNAATSTPTVKALVFIDAYVPAEGETALALTGAKPGSLLGAKDPKTVFDFVQYPGAPDGDFDAYIRADKFKSIIAANLPAKLVKQLEAEQRPVTLSALGTPSAAPAWKTIKSYYFVGLDDKVLPAAEQIAMAKRAHAVIVKAHAPHLSMLSAPAHITDLIEKAAKHVG